MANTILNTKNCDSELGNTGIPKCAFDPTLMEGGFLVPPGFELTKAQLATSATLQTALAAAILDIPSKRIYPLPKFEAVTDSSEDVVTQTLGYGAPVTIREGKNVWIFQYLIGGVCLNNQLRTFNKSGYRVMFIDGDNNMVATKNKTNDGAVGITLVDYYAYPWKLNDGSNTTAYRLKFVFDPKYVNEWVAFFNPADFNLIELTGLQQVYLNKVSRALGVIKVTAQVGCGGDDLHALYADELADESLWVATNAATGANIPITSVADDTVDNGWTITLDTTGTPPYTAGAVVISLAAPSVLAAAGVDGYASKPLSVTIP